MGHKVLSIRRGVDASLPYFIPMIPPLGTMGAVIITRTPAPNRDALMDVAAAGPLAGFLVSIPVLILGVSRSFIIISSMWQGGTIHEPLILHWLIRTILHPANGMDVLAHPILFAGWIGLFVTSLNLLPAGMLDGGHVVRSLLGPRLHMLLSVVAVVVTVLIGAYLMALVIVLLMRRGHPGPLDDVSPASPGRIVLGLILLGVLIVSIPMGRLF
jgi:membrane-associated protease RseP (regulator of RpoE activity)